MPEQASSAVVQQNMLNTPSFWNACLGYMAYLRQDYPTAKSRFELAKTSAEPIPASVERQLEVLNVLLTATTAPLNAQGEELFEQGFQLLKPHAIIKEGSAQNSALCCFVKPEPTLINLSFSNRQITPPNISVN